MELKKLYTLVFVRNKSKILLGWKKRGFGENKWNGFGGKVEPKETILEAAARELKEECCISVNTKNLTNVGILEFTFEDNPVIMDVRVFTTSIYEGVAKETEEMRPKWFDVDSIPFDKMWPDDKYWFPYKLNNKLFYAKFHYQGFDTILHYNIKELQSNEDFKTIVK